MNKLKNNAWFRKAGMALLDIVLIVLSVYLSMELRFEMYIPSRHMETMYAAMPDGGRGVHGLLCAGLAFTDHVALCGRA